MRLNTAAVIGLVVGVLVVMVLMYTCGLLTGSLVQRQRGGAGKCSPTSAPTSPVAPDTAAVQLPPVYEQVLPPATTSTSIPLEENVAYICTDRKIAIHCNKVILCTFNVFVITTLRLHLGLAKCN